VINWIFDWLRSVLGHWLLEKEEADERARDVEIARKQKEILEQDYTVEDTARDFESGEF